jgi:hypothetical protein
VVVVVWLSLEVSLAIGMGWQGRRWVGLGLAAFIIIVAVVGWRAYLADRR